MIFRKLTHTAVAATLLSLGSMAMVPAAFAQEAPSADQPVEATPLPAPAETVEPATPPGASKVSAIANPTGPDYYLVDTSLTSDPENVLLLDLSNGGRVAIRLKPDWAPEHVARIKQLAQSGFYNGIIFHRVIDGFMAQTGDPTGTGGGGSELPDLKAEFNRVPHLRGTVSMARRGDSDDSANSQFFIVFYPTMAIDGKYTVFGRVIAGMNYVDAITRGSPPAEPTRIVQASLASNNRPKPAVAPPASEITADMLNNSASSPAGGAE